MRSNAPLSTVSDLHSAGTKFIEKGRYFSDGWHGYSFLPLRFDRFDEGRYIVTNDAGEFLLIRSDEFERFVTKRLTPADTCYADLKAKFFLSDETCSAHARVLASKFKTKKSFLDGFTKLHMFVPTLRCNQSCGYCQVSRVNADAAGYDMTDEIARKAVDTMLMVPAPSIAMEFQGGEPLLRFDLVKYMIDYAIEQNTGRKQISFVICTNLTCLTDEHLDFFKERGVEISTSFDGPATIHDVNRPLKGDSAYGLVLRNIERAREALGRDAVSVLMTTTKLTLGRWKEVIDEYVRLNLGAIFIRELNPYGFAAKSARSLGYTSQEFVSFYKAALDYIIKLNLQGYGVPEAYASILLRKIMTPYPTGFVDLQSPTGIGFGAVIYNHNGKVYASDESRMLGEMGDDTFCLGSVLTHSYADLFFGETMQTVGAAGCSESLPGCSDCAYQPYCGADPVRHYTTQGDLFGHRPTSQFCQKNKAILHHLVTLVADSNPDIQRVLWSWVTRQHHDTLRLPSPQWL